MHANIDEGTKVGHVGHNARAAHAGFEIFDFTDIVSEAEWDKFISGISAGFF